MIHISPIVEGYGDFEAVPVLLRMINPELKVSRPVRFPRTRLVIESELQRAVHIAKSNLTQGDAAMVLLVMDADEDCPAVLGPRLVRIMEAVSRPFECYVSLAMREFESWIVGGIEEFDVAIPDSTGSLKQRILALNEGRYQETIDQTRFTSKINIESLAAKSPSFSRLYRRVRRFTSESGLTA